ncbi:MAG: hypothetical protein ACLFPL_04785 [Candidatus Nanoarchaeia archaeon]
MMDIDVWMQKFKEYWLSYDIEGVISLFDDEVEYWESSFQRIEHKQELREEWEYIKAQHNIKFAYDIFSQENDKYSIIWKLKYNNKEVRGTYLLKLNQDNKCTYFYQTCEEKE